jgi:hypothetical protein
MNSNKCGEKIGIFCSLAVGLLQQCQHGDVNMVALQEEEEEEVTQG